MATKVFVGNLAFRTTDQDLQTHFAGHGEIKSSIIITRGRRSLGYGFVEYANQADAEAAATALDQSNLFDRTIKVEIAKDPSEREPREPRQPREPREPKQPRQPREPKQPKQPKENNEGEQKEGDGPAPKRRTRKPRGKRSPKNNGDSAPSSPAESSSSPDASGEKKKRVRKPRAPRPQTEKVLSKTTLFVANLPFSIDDAALADIFSGFVSARVVRTRNGRSRGYGFVEFGSEEQQQTALTEKQGHKISGQNGVERAISISVSSSSPEATEGAEQETQQ